MGGPQFGHSEGMKKQFMAYRSPRQQPMGRRYGRWTLGAGLLFTGVSHLTWNRKAFLAQVPGWVPFDGDFVVVSSGVVEIVLGSALVAWATRRVHVGWVVAAFFVVIFPGNISQLTSRTDSFGLNSDASRAVRLLFQPLLVAWALWSTDAWSSRTAL